MIRAWCAVVIGVLLAGSAAATEERALTTSQLECYDRVTHALIAPCCWREPIAIHGSEEALQMLGEVRQLVAEGHSEEEIRAIYVERYGDRILADPPGRAGQWLYAVPVGLLCGLIFCSILRLRSLVAGVAVPAPVASADLMARVRMETENEWM